MKILIADDEELLRFTLKSMLEEINLPIEIIGEADNGEKAVELVEAYRPDIAFVDIRMPKMDGLEAIKQAKKLSLNTQWVILTGFAEFDYAKEAVSLGVSHYLLKPLSVEDLEEVLKKLVDNNQKNILISNLEFENDMAALLNGIVQTEDLSCKYASALTDYKCMIVICDGYLEPGVKSGLKSGLNASLRDKLGKYLTNDTRFALTALSEREILVVAAGGKAMGTREGSEIDKYFERVFDAIQGNNSLALSFTALESMHCMSLEELYRQIHKLRSVLKYRTLAGIGKKLTYGELSLYERQELFTSLSESLVKLALSMEESVPLTFTNELILIENMLCGNKAKLFDPAVKAAIWKYIGCILGHELMYDGNLSASFREIKELGLRSIEERYRVKIQKTDIVKEIMDFIDKNYSLNIGINQIAEQMGFTPNYLSSLFHKKTGMTYISYLTNVRMNKAKEFLQNPNDSIQKIAGKIGYYNTPHFSRLFKKQFGMYPSEYRDSQKQ